MAAMDTSTDTPLTGMSWSNGNPFMSSLFQQPIQPQVAQMQPPTFQLGSFLQPVQPQIDINQQENIKNHFNKVNTCGGHFAEAFHYLLTVTPDAIRSYQPTKYIRILQGSTKFEARHEQNFIEKIRQYNSLSCAKFNIGYKKDLLNSNAYTVSYELQFSGKN